MPCGLRGIRGAPVLIVVVLLACEEATSGPASVPVPPLPSSALSGDRAALGALYEATGGPNWTRRDNWMSEAPVDAWQGVEANPAGDVLRLTLANNNLRGRIPPELGNLVALEKLELSRNRLAGLIPPELGHLASLEELQLSGNNLTGSVPPEFGRLTRLQLLSVSHNPRLAGPLPVSLMVLDRLERIETAGTALCASADPDFQAWTLGVTGQLPRCLDDTGPTTVYLTQAVQSRSIPVPLVADRSALLRVFVTVPDSTTATIPPVRATFHVDGVKTYTAEIPAGGGVIPTTVSEDRWAASANARIPGEVMRPGLELVVEIDPEGRLDASLGISRRIPEQGRLTVDVLEMPVLELTLIPFLWGEAPDEEIVEIIDAMAADPERHPLLHDTRTLLPVSGLKVTAHEPVLSSSNLDLDLIRQTRLIRIFEHGDGHYMGMMSGPMAGAAGRGEIAGRTSVSRPYSPTIAHELGHNMNLLHAPCGNPDRVDPSYPHANGTIGDWGYDYWQSLVAPGAHRDLMSYCNPKWISGYHFNRALQFRVADEDPAPAATRGGDVAAGGRSARSLLLWGGVDAAGMPFLEPAFVVDAPTTLPETGAGAFELEGRTRGGEVLFSLGFDMPEVADGGGNSAFVFVLPTDPQWPGELASIVLSGPGGTALLDGDTDRPMLILRNARTGQVRAFLSDPPPASLAGSVVDVGALPPEPGLDALFSRGLPAPREWRR